MRSRTTAAISCVAFSDPFHLSIFNRRAFIIMHIRHQLWHSVTLFPHSLFDYCVPFFAYMRILMHNSS